MKPFIYLFFLLISCSVNAQFDRGANKISDGLAWGQFDGLAIMQTKQFRKDRVYIKDSHSFVQGSPYYDKTLKKSVVTFFDKVVPQEIYLRYNANTDELEMSSYQHDGQTDQMLLPDKDLKAKIGTETYKYLTYYNTIKKEELLNGYFITLIENSHYSLYLKKTKVFREAKLAKTSLERSFPARFEEKVQFYFKNKDNPLLPLKPNKSSLIKNFDKKTVKKILNKLPTSLGNQQFLKKFIEELNSSY